MSGLLWAIEVTYMHWLSKYYQTNISSNLSFTYFSNISTNPSFNYVSEAKVVWNHKGFVLGLTRKPALAVWWYFQRHLQTELFRSASETDRYSLVKHCILSLTCMLAVSSFFRDKEFGNTSEAMKAKVDSENGNRSEVFSSCPNSTRAIACPRRLSGPWF